MNPQAETSHQQAAAAEAEVQQVYLTAFPDGAPDFVSEAFQWTTDCFAGRYPGYQPIDARYHDLEHTLQGTLCMVRLLNGRHQANCPPPCTQRFFELGLLAILLHDTGYLKENGDDDGTGAKYTVIHVQRSAEFAARLLIEKGFSPRETRSVQHMIRCTGVNVNLSSIPFQSDLERIVGFALGTADLLGQMAADDYVDKLPILFEEFAESQAYSGAIPDRMNFASADDLIRKTRGFWEFYVKPKIQKDFGGLYEFLREPYPDGPNPYLERIEANLRRLP